MRRTERIVESLERRKNCFSNSNMFIDNTRKYDRTGSILLRLNVKEPVNLIVSESTIRTDILAYQLDYVLDPIKPDVQLQYAAYEPFDWITVV